MTSPEVFVVRDRTLLLEAVTARLVTQLVERQAAASRASLLISSDSFTHDLVSSLAQKTIRDIVAWDAVDVWWSDTNWARPGLDDQLIEQFLALKVPEAAIHPMKSLRRTGRAMDAVAGYAGQLAEAMAPDDHGPIPTFDVSLLPIGVDGGVAGLHPERPTLYDNSPISVDTRSRQITLTLPALNSARQVWLVASGEGVAPAVALALSGGGPTQVPAGSVTGTTRTLLLLDEAAAERLPRDLRRASSP